jgi:hypothetical protein
MFQLKFFKRTGVTFKNLKKKKPIINFLRYYFALLIYNENEIDKIKNN